MRDMLAITGDIGSGKSTVAKLVAERLQFEFLSTGSMQRAIAAQRGLTTLQLNEASVSDKQMDTTIDDCLRRLNREGNRLVLDSRLAWHFVDQSLRIFLTVDPVVAAQRILAAGRTVEVHHGVDDAVGNNLRRKELEDSRFLQLYGIQCDRLTNYDMVLDSTWVTPARCTELILAVHAARTAAPAARRSYLCPRRLVPTQDLPAGAPALAPAMLDAMARAGYDALAPIDVVRCGQYFLIVDGHRRASCALRLHLDFIPCILHDADAPTVTAGITYGMVARAALARPAAIAAWAAAHDFAFASLPTTDGSVSPTGA